MAFVSIASSFVPVQTKSAADRAASDELAAATRTKTGASASAAAFAAQYANVEVWKYANMQTPNAVRA